MKEILFTLFISFSFILSSASAAVLIQAKDNVNNITSFYIQGNQAHIVMPNNAGYIVMDLNKKITKIALHKERMIIDISNFFKNDYASAPTKYIDTYTKTMGLGPTIIGYETEEIAMFANDQYCGSMFVSVNAMRDLGLKKFARAFLDLENNFDAKMQQLMGVTTNNVESPCRYAERKTSMRIRDIGFPLKSTDNNKNMDSIIIKASKNARLPANAFSLPDDYKVVNLLEWIKQYKH